MTLDLRAALSQALGPSIELGPELRGGMARIFTARDSVLDRRLVVKTLGDAPLGGAEADRFRREILMAASLQHPNIVPLLSAGTTQDGMPFYVMPFVEGETLRTRLTRGAVPPHEVAEVIRDVARALGAAHRRGIVHRDIKPENIFSADGVAVVSDFGVSKALDAASAVRATATGVAIGTPAYMAPEQASADPSAGARADLYSLGLVAWELLAGRHPFEGLTAGAMLAAHISRPVPAIESVVPGVPGELAALIGTLLEKSPARRPVDADAVVATLATVITPSATVVPPRPTKWRARWSLVAGIATIAIIAGIVLMRGRRAPPASPASASPSVAGWESTQWSEPVTHVRVPTGDTLVRDLLEDASTAVRGPEILDDTATAAASAVTITVRRRGRSIAFETLQSRSLTALPLGLPEAELRERLGGVLLVISSPELGSWALPAGLPPRAEQVRQFLAFARLSRNRVGSAENGRVELAGALERLVADAADWPMAALLGETWSAMLAPGPRVRVITDLASRRIELTAAEQTLLDVLLATERRDENGRVIALRAFVRETGSAEFARLLARQETLRGGFPEAISLFRALGPGPGREHLPYWSALTTAEHLLGRHADELRDADVAQTESGSRLGVRMYRLRALAALGRTTEAQTETRALTSLPSEDFISVGWAMRQMALELQLHGQAEAAGTMMRDAEQWYRALPERQRTVRSLAEHAHVLAAQGQGDEALQSVASALQLSDSRDLIALRAVIAARLGRFDEAKRSADLWRRRPADQAAAWNAILSNYLTETGVIPGGPDLVEARLDALTGNRERAVAELASAFRDRARSPSLMLLHADPDFASLRSEPKVRVLFGAP
ncbi:MAG: serine/threonine protein kinase [Gemmatimonadetes bacterium]|nr:serine/threonine protein kinase [Gemmatimonadota bacterium]